MVSMIRRWDVLGNDGAVAQPTWLPLPLFRAAQFYFNLRHVRVVHPFGAELIEASASLFCCSKSSDVIAAVLTSKKRMGLQNLCFEPEFLCTGPYFFHSTLAG